MSDRRTPRLNLILSGAIAFFVVVAIFEAFHLVGELHSQGLAAPANPVQVTRRALPEGVAHIPLVNQSGEFTDLAAFRGRVVVLADFMTSCQEECPITTGALLTVNHDLKAANLADKVVVVEVSVDGWRDSPSRLLAYQKTFGVPLTLLSGSVANIQKLWHWFGVYYERVKESSPPDIDWQTGAPYTFDVAHTDDVFVLGTNGNERAIVEGNADVSGKLPKVLEGLLSAQGQRDLTHPGTGSWTPPDLLSAIGVVLGRAIPIPGAT